MTSTPNSDLHDPAPPQPQDSPATRPPLDLPHVINQVKGIQTFLAWEEARRQQREQWKRELEKKEPQK
jgi:hypothetical protein